MASFALVKEKLKSLPVNQVADAVVASVMKGEATVLAAPTGSGKSMIVPGQLADAIEAANPTATAKQKQVVVLVPRRFLAIDAASNVAALSGTKLGQEVGYAVGGLAGDKSEFSPDTKVLYATYGYAISSGLINTADNIVLDEVHEAGEDSTLARAILYERKKKEPALRILEMSATINAERQANYWAGVATPTVHMVEGSQLVCDLREVNPRNKGSKSYEETIIDLLGEGRQGIAAFRSGIRDIESTVNELEKLVAENHIPNVEIVSIYGGTPPDERRQALAPPKKGWRKIVVGTNVIESGMNIPWLDAGISDGVGKIAYDRIDTGAEALTAEELPQWRVVQQMGRINRDPKYTGFDSGIFVLHSSSKLESRYIESTPELERISFNRTGFHAAALGLNPKNLHIDANIEDRIALAEKELQRLELIDEDWKLTKAGKYVSKLPISPEGGAMLWEAVRLDAVRGRDREKKPPLLPDAIIIAALAEYRGMRDDYFSPHGKDYTSDLIDGLKTYRIVSKYTAAQTVTAATDTIIQQLLKDSRLEDRPHEPLSPDQQQQKLFAQQKLADLDKQRARLKEICKSENVSFTSFVDVARLVGEIRDRQPNKELLAKNADVPFDKERYHALKRVILNGHINRLFETQDEKCRDLIRDGQMKRGEPKGKYANYEMDVSAVRASKEDHFIAGRLKKMPPCGDILTEPRTVLIEATLIPDDVFSAWLLDRDDKDRILTKIRHHNDPKTPQRLEGNYCGNGLMTVALPKEMTVQQAQSLEALLAMNEVESGHVAAIKREAKASKSQGGR